MTTKFIDEVKQEIADAASGGTSTLVDEVEADLMIFGTAKDSVGKFKVSHETSNTSTKKLKLTLNSAFIDKEADAGHLCSLRVT